MTMNMSKLTYDLLKEELQRAAMKIRAGGRANIASGLNIWAKVVSARKALEAPKSGIHFTRPTGTFKCGELIVNFDNATLQYGDNKIIRISPENRESKFLYLLIKWQDRVVVDEIIAERLNLKGRQARDVQFVMRDLKKLYLRKAGMPKSAIKTMFLRKKDRGYQLIS